MPRNLDSNTSVSLNNPVVPIAIMVNIGLSSGNGAVYVWSGYGDLSYNGNTYAGVGKFGKVSLIQETNQVYASGATITLEGVDSSDLSDALSEIPIGQPATIYLAVMAPQNSLAGDPIPLFSGNTDQVSISENATGSSISIDIESKLSQLQRNREYRYTDQMQRYLYPNDAAFQYVNMLTDYIGTWGFARGDQS